ncbi:hypothetical protein P7K49_019238 [Saguinus oedipus]|uniref:Alpha-macroglobulin receptor-binding domain-containing protein n=1 Tax=Saguinus oedipus TaxID=9490 RepID=A0ABQ9UZB6_SAGOE|nr:hypothetical protein P7K49_019238 [Saguinus oedipus]
MLNWLTLIFHSFCTEIVQTVEWLTLSQRPTAPAQMKLPRNLLVWLTVQVSGFNQMDMLICPPKSQIAGLTGHPDQCVLCGVSLHCGAGWNGHANRKGCTGDLLGSAMQNLQNLLHLPFGCGEQNMALFTPNIYILDYLSQTQQLTEEIKSKAIGYLTTVQSQTLIWLSNIQKPDGCFLNFGKVFNNALKGKEDDEISLTAYVISALLEAGHPVSFTVIQKGLQCIETISRERAVTTYEQALLAYTYSLVGYEDKREFFFNELSKKAQLFEKASSADIEITCYGLLALLSKPRLTSEELSYASQIVHWVAKQQNSHGGFSSTKDTIVALQALTLFQRLTFSKSRQNSVQIFSQAFNTAFQVNDKNRLLLQQILLPTTKGEYTVEVNGNGCVYVQRNSSNMAIIDVKMLSGFVPDRPSVKKLQEDGKVQRVEIKTTHVFFYLENVTQKEIHFSFSVKQDALVSNIKPASVQLFDYYETDEFALAEYSTPCGQMSFETSF